jgi:lipoprotein-anchoring transpeptidase ErfK/SrfK
MRSLFSGEIDPGSLSYTPSKGEGLYQVSRKFNMCPELLIEINGIKGGEKIPDRLKIVPGHFTIMVERGKNILTLYREGRFFKEYKVASGRDLSTPLGEYWIASKLISPPWLSEGKVITPDQPDYPLGTRWMGLSGTRIGLHGTKDPEYIGQSVSSGCIRMLNSDIEELYKIVPFGTKVTIRE